MQVLGHFVASMAWPGPRQAAGAACEALLTVPLPLRAQGWVRAISNTMLELDVITLQQLKDKIARWAHACMSARAGGRNDGRGLGHAHWLHDGAPTMVHCASNGHVVMAHHAMVRHVTACPNTTAHARARRYEEGLHRSPDTLEALKDVLNTVNNIRIESMTMELKCVPGRLHACGGPGCVARWSYDSYDMSVGADAFRHALSRAQVRRPGGAVPHARAVRAALGRGGGPGGVPGRAAGACACVCYRGVVWCKVHVCTS